MGDEIIPEKMKIAISDDASMEPDFVIPCVSRSVFACGIERRLPIRVRPGRGDGRP